MSPESEQTVTKKHTGRHREVSSKPFARALYELAQSRGFRTQEELTRGLGLKAKASVGKYSRGEHMPSPETFGIILATLKPNEEELENLVIPFIEDLIDKRVKGGQRSRRSSNLLIGQLIEKISDSRRITLEEFSQEMDISSSRIRDLRGGRKWTLELLSGLLDRAPEAFDLTQGETEKLSSAVVLLIEDAVGIGRDIKSISPNIAHKVFHDLPCQTYTGGDLARELNISREAVRKRREKLRIENVILTEADRRRIVKYNSQGSLRTTVGSA